MRYLLGTFAALALLGASPAFAHSYVYSTPEVSVIYDSHGGAYRHAPRHAHRHHDHYYGHHYYGHRYYGHQRHHRQHHRHGHGHHDRHYHGHHYRYHSCD